MAKIPRNGFFYKDGKFMTTKYSDGTTWSIVPSQFDDIPKFEMINDGEIISGQYCPVFQWLDWKFEILDFGIDNEKN